MGLEEVLEQTGVGHEIEGLSNPVEERERVQYAKTNLAKLG